MRTLHGHVQGSSDLGPNVREVRIDVRPFALEGRLLLPAVPRGSIIFGSGFAAAGWQPHSPAGELAASFRRKGFAVLLLDVLAPPPGHSNGKVSRFETALLSARIVVAADWLTNDATLRGRPIGCLAFGEAGASAVIAAAERPSSIRAVVAADPRLDAAEAALLSLASPLLMVVGTHDRIGSSSAQSAIKTPGGRQMQIRHVSGTFGELSRARVAEVGRLAQAWYERYLR